MNRRRWLGAQGLLATAFTARAAGQIAPDAAAARVPASVPGGLPSEHGGRSPEFEPERIVSGRALSGWSQTPLGELTGLITPSDLHFERHHGGIPALSAAEHELFIHGLVERPRRFTLADLKQFPIVTRQHFVECSGNGFASTLEPGAVPAALKPGDVDGLFSHSEWTGVLLRDLLQAVGAKRRARWALAEGADSAAMTRSIPMRKLMDDALLAFGQNGEPLRPAQGYPLRLLLPGFEGNMSIKWLHRLELADRPFMTREETARYSDPRPDGRVELFTFSMGPKSLITSPAYPERLAAPGPVQVSGLAWTGAGRLRSVEVSVDGGRRWRRAELTGPALDQAPQRFALRWAWDGRPTVLMSRATATSGLQQPSYSDFLNDRTGDTRYHNNAIRSWQIDAEGQVTFAMRDPEQR